MKIRVVLGISSSICIWNMRASAREARFGEAGQVVVLQETSGSFTNMSDSFMSSTFVSLAPSMHVFVLRGLSVGGVVAYTKSWLRYHTIPSSLDSDALALAPRVGVAIPLGGSAAFWPSAGVYYSMYWSAQEVSGETTHSRSTSMSLVAGAPVVFQVAPQFFLGFGPQLSQELQTSPKSDMGLRRWLAVTMLLGGNF